MFTKDDEIYEAALFLFRSTYLIFFLKPLFVWPRENIPLVDWILEEHLSSYLK